jgi:hypothetical protein
MSPVTMSWGWQPFWPFFSFSPLWTSKQLLSNLHGLTTFDLFNEELNYRQSMWKQRMPKPLVKHTYFTGPPPSKISTNIERFFGRIHVEVRGVLNSNHDKGVGMF